MIPLKTARLLAIICRKSLSLIPGNLVFMLGYEDCGWPPSLAGWQAQHSNPQGPTGFAMSYMAAAKGGPSRAEPSL